MSRNEGQPERSNEKKADVKGKRTANPPFSEDRQFVTALARGLEILRCFTPSTPELGTTDIARMTRLPQSTVWRLCHTMVRLGFLRTSSNGEGLRLGIPALGLGYAVLADNPVGELALPYMQELADKYRGAVSLGARDGLSMIYLQRCQGSFIILPHLRVGSRVPLASSATGWAYLVGLEEQERDELIEEIRHADTKEWSRHSKQFHQAHQRYLDTGYIVNKGALHADINSVAVPIQGDKGATLLTLSSGGINTMFNDAALEAIGKELLVLAGKLSPALSSRVLRGPAVAS